MRSWRGALTIRVALAVQPLLLGKPAQGADSRLAALPIKVELAGCEALDQVELYKLLAIEFHTLNLLPANPPERVRVECEAQRALVTLATGNTSNEVDLTATAPAVWPRLLALSVSEIVIESRARATPAPVAPVATPAPAPPTPDPPTQIRPGNSAFRGSAGVALRHAFRPATWLAGPDLGVTLQLSRYFSLAADLRLELGHTDTTLAKVDWLSASGAFAMLVGGNVGRWSFGVGPGVCIGYLRLSPQVQVANATGHTVSGVWAGPELVARVRYDLGSRWFVLGGVDAGFVSTSVIGLVNGEQRLIDTGGAWASAMLGAGMQF